MYEIIYRFKKIHIFYIFRHIFRLILEKKRIFKFFKEFICKIYPKLKKYEMRILKMSMRKMISFRVYFIVILIVFVSITLAGEILTVSESSSIITTSKDSTFIFKAKTLGVSNYIYDALLLVLFIFSLFLYRPIKKAIEK